MNDNRTKELLELGASIVSRAKDGGADVAEVLISDSAELSAKIRMGEPELIEEAASHGIGLRVIKDNKTAATHTSDPTEAGLDALVSDALELAALSEPDPLQGPPDPALLSKDHPDLTLFDPNSDPIDARWATDQALAAEQAARDLDPRISNSEGATYARNRGRTVLVTSGGFEGTYAGTYHSLSVMPLAEDEGGKKRVGSYWDARRFVEQMKSAKDIGAEAARRTLDKLGARKVETTKVPVVFDPDAGRALLSLFFSCVTGNSIYKRSSYLVDREGEKVASDLVTIVDDPLIPRAPGSRPFDGEGLASRKNVVVDAGVLKTYLLDGYSARKLDRESTGNASRGMGGRIGVSPTNFHLLAGQTSPADIIGSVDRGLYVTSMMGFGFSAVTGDFSRGAEGFWIEKGEKAYPVGEITISLNFNDLWAAIDKVGNDLDPKTRYACPTFRVAEMTIAGT